MLFLVLRALLLLSIIHGKKRYMKNNKMSKKLLTMILLLALTAVFSVVVTTVAKADEQKSEGTKIGVGGFLDEDGDGFNDLMPDSDGDGVPDALDPDSRNRQSDNNMLHDPMNAAGDTTGVRHKERMGDDHQPIMHDGSGPMMPNGPIGPGEPGQFGPNDSTGHGGMGGDGHRPHRGGDGMGGDPDSSNMGGGGHRPIIGPRDGYNSKQVRENVERENSNIEAKPKLENNTQSNGAQGGGK